MSQVWLLIPSAPLLAALVLLLFGQRAQHVLWLSASPALLIAALPPEVLQPDFLWPAASWGLETMLQRGLLGGSALLWLCAGLFSLSRLREDPRRLAYQQFWLLSLSGNLLWLIAGDALSFYVGFSLMSLAAYGLIVHERTTPSRQAARLYLQIAMTGELLLFTGMMLAWHESGGSFLFATWREAQFSSPTLLCLIIGLGLKAGFWPLHVWLPLAHPVAPAGASAVLSGAMIKAGIAGLWLMLPTQSVLLQQWSLPLLWLGLTGLFYGAMLGLLRRDTKEALAFSSVSQMGYLLLITAMAWHEPEMRPVLMTVVTLYAVHHGFAKGSLFMAAELLKTAWPGHMAARLALSAGLLLPALAIGGFPFTSGAAVKTALKDQLEPAGLEHYSLVLQFGAIASTLIMLRVLWTLRSLATSAPDATPSRFRLTGWAIPASASVLLPVLNPTMRDALMDSLPLYRLLNLTWPVLLAVALALPAVILQWRLPDGLVRLHSPALYVSLRLRRWLQRPAAVPAPDPEQLPPRRTRALERRWNRWWPHNAISSTIWLLLAVLLVGSLFMN